MNKNLERWTIEKSEDLYGIKNWSGGYFDLSENGEVVVTPKLIGKDRRFSLLEIISGIQDRGLNMPVLLRLDNILDSQITRLHENFRKAIKEFEYKGAYRGVYPIKVNQQQQVLEEVARFGSRYHHGFEAGSKAELIAALSMFTDKEACLVCNGYKDEEFVDLGLYATKMGYKCFLVIEMLNELPLILKRAKEMNVRPLIGVRLKISSKASGHWTESGGDRSIFGLNTTQIIDVVDILKQHDMLDCLQLLHYHLGSQIPNIRDIRSALIEACRVYTELVSEGATMGYLDIGGGLGVDYDGSKSNFMNSMNYGLKEYCSDVVEVIMSVLDENDTPHPVIISESGRATVAYYSVLLFNVLDVRRFEALPLPESLDETLHDNIKNLLEVSQNINIKNIQECYNDAIFYRDEIRELFKHGEITLRERSLSEKIFWNIINSIVSNYKKLKRRPIELENIDVALSDIYYCNFSVFQSLPDAWAIGQMFPTMPIHRLHEKPTRNAILADITCDCDGKIDKFIDLHDVRHSLPLHELVENEEYSLGVFLVGAYQETLGDSHNLLGDTNVVSIRFNEDGSYDFVRELEGDSVADVLSYVEYDPKAMIVRFRETAEKAVRENKISVAERREIMQAFDSGLRGYTHYEK